MTRLTVVLSAIALLLSLPVATHAIALQQKPENKTAAGTWTMTAETSHGAMEFTLELKQDGEKLTGMFKAQAGDFPVAGQAVNGALTFKMTQPPENYFMLSFKAKMKDDGTMSGTMSSDNGDMAFTAKRAK